MMTPASSGIASPQERSWSASLSTTRTVPALETLFDALGRDGIRYCHWKSNFVLAATLRGETDLDLLVHRADAPRFLSAIASLGYKPVAAEEFPSICHYYGLDEQAGTLIDLHIYYRLITGGTIKNYHLPVEDMLLRSARPVAGVYVPDRA